MDQAIAHQTAVNKKAVMLSTVEAWWASLYAPPFDGAQVDSPFLESSNSFCLLMGY